jgi:hypothetical protein
MSFPIAKRPRLICCRERGERNEILRPDYARIEAACLRLVLRERAFLGQPARKVCRFNPQRNQPVRLVLPERIELSTSPLPREAAPLTNGACRTDGAQVPIMTLGDMKEIAERSLEVFIAELPADRKQFGAVNWADLRVVDVIACKSAYGHEWTRIEIEEASPDSSLGAAVYMLMKAAGAEGAFEVVTEW